MSDYSNPFISNSSTGSRAGGGRIPGDITSAKTDITSGRMVNDFTSREKAARPAERMFDRVCQERSFEAGRRKGVRRKGVRRKREG